MKYFARAVLYLSFAFIIVSGMHTYVELKKIEQNNRPASSLQIIPFSLPITPPVPTNQQSEEDEIHPPILDIPAQIKPNIASTI